ncbi:DNA-3-methyladenine glycosylase [Corynebacterium liangguodongii]|uniref:Putative 3-methyladenine DNA glycosylase n=1 Tax=Corynebacterium liangguodongii TaxID=2079535 RepID=A0A2S0WGX9_9CORY|nr:DNA-3-methyladenine glycosylase [Corynebacterium liangguodongii]AWB85025.1 DNA-3-methyladenine glycosylase [Corynebacterium liangguodongii]PWB99600.1 DNA-3-methyladenine glycosylase [Corynebacterium liangguodongii]
MIDFTQPADIVAPQLLGCVIEHGGVRLRLTEVEAYLGENDPASHTFNGKTARNAAMFGPPGRLYVYLSYGIHHNGNIVCAPEGTGQGCLLRAGEVVGGVEIAAARRGETPFANLARGPGNLGKSLGLSLTDNGAPVRITAPDSAPEWVAGPRVGITKNAAAPLRFWIPGEATVSRPRGRR